MLSEIVKIIEFVFEAFLKMAPFIIVTIPIAAAVNVFDLSKNIKSYLENKKHTAIIIAALIGSISPLCSCGVIPLITALLISGVPLAPVMAFWIASPSMDPEIFFLSVSALGWDLAIWRLFSTFILSVSAGYITYYLTHIKFLSTQVLKDHFITAKPEPVSEHSCCTSVQKSEFIQVEKTIAVDVQTSCCSPALSLFNPNKKRSKLSSFLFDEEKKDLRKKFIEESKKTIVLLMKFLTLAFILEAIIIRYVPEQLIVEYLGSQSTYGILLSSLVGVPLYTSGIATLPLVEGMISQGMSGAAALTFLISGPTTTIPALAAVYGIAKRKVFILYLAFSLIGSVFFGYAFHILN